MKNETIIIEDAVEFVDLRIDSYFQKDHGLHLIIDELKANISLYYQVEYKILYLNTVRNKLNELLERYNSETNINRRTIYNYYLRIRLLVDQEMERLPQLISRNAANLAENRTKVFISYSTKDEEYIKAFRIHAKTLESEIDFWDATKLKLGEVWDEKIKASISACKVGILMISPDFLASDYIQTTELDALLDKAANEGATIIPVYLRPCYIEKYPQITKYQGINNPRYPLSRLNRDEQDEFWVELLKKVSDPVL